MVEGCNSSFKAAKIRPMGHLEIMQIFCSFTSGWSNLNRWIFKGDLFKKKKKKKKALCFLWLFQMCAGLYHVRVMDHEQLTLCSISVILHSRQSTGNLSYSGKTKCGPCRYPQRLQSVFRIHSHVSKVTVPKVPLEAPWRGQGAGTHWSQKTQPVLEGALPGDIGWALNTAVDLIALNFYSLCSLSLKGRAGGREKLNFWRIWLLTSVSGPTVSLAPARTPGSWRFNASWIDVRLV